MLLGQNDRSGPLFLEYSLTAVDAKATHVPRVPWFLIGFILWVKRTLAGKAASSSPEVRSKAATSARISGVGSRAPRPWITGAGCSTMPSICG